MSPSADRHVFRGTLVHTPVFGQIDLLLDTLVVVLAGKIQRIVPGQREQEVLQALGIPAGAVHRLSAGQFLLPGFIDTHVHAPQYQFTGTGTDVPLMEWLHKYTFPTEASFSDLEAAYRRYKLLVKRLLANGTTTATYFGSLHLAPNKVLVEAIMQLGQRAVVGKVSMDRESPDAYTEPTQQGLKDAEEFVQFVLTKNCTRIYPCITPRFIPTSTMESMQGLAAIARKYDTHIQSHISECCGEVALVRQLHPDHKSDACVFDAAGLLTGKAVMAHGTLLTDDCIRLLAARGTSISHCPLSNFYFGDACFRVNHAMKLGLQVGLGTDVAGGISPAMLTAVRMAVVNSRCLRAHKLASMASKGMVTEVTPGMMPGVEVLVSKASAGVLEVTPDVAEDVLTWKEGLYLATLGGAKALTIDHQVGSFEEGKDFDALLVDVTAPGGPIDVFEGDSLTDQVEKFINLGDDRNILEVYVQGTRVKSGNTFAGENRHPIAPEAGTVAAASGSISNGGSAVGIAGIRTAKTGTKRHIDALQVGVTDGQCG